MRIECVSGLRVDRSIDCKQTKRQDYSPSMTGAYAKPETSGMFEKFVNYIKSKMTPQNEKYVKQVKNNISNMIPLTRPLEVKNQRTALSKFISDENFSKKVIIKGNDGSCEVFYRQFDPVTHETIINADFYDSKKKLNHTTVYDNNGLKLNQYFVKLNSPKDPISIRRKYFNTAGKIVHEEIKYKNGDVTNIDYDYLHGTQRFETLNKDGTKVIVINTKHTTIIQHFDEKGNEISKKVTEY